MERHRLVMDAYLAVWNRQASRARPVKIASFFVSRVDTEIDKRLEKIGTDQAMALRGAGVANARLARGARRCSSVASGTGR